MNLEPRLSIHMEKQLGGVSGDLQVGANVLARLMESQIWHQPANSVALWWEGSEKRTMAPSCLSIWEKAVLQLSP